MDGVAALGQVLPALTLILAVLLAVRWWTTRGGPRRAGTSLRVLSRTSLSRTSVVAVVDVDGRRFLIGSGEHGSTLLAELEGGEAEPSAAGDGTTDHEPRSPGWDRSTPGPRTGLLDRIRAMTVRTPVARSPRVPELLRR